MRALVSNSLPDFPSADDHVFDCSHGLFSKEMTCVAKKVPNLMHLPPKRNIQQPVPPHVHRRTEHPATHNTNTSPGAALFPAEMAQFLHHGHSLEHQHKMVMYWWHKRRLDESLCEMHAVPLDDIEDDDVAYGLGRRRGLMLQQAQADVDAVIAIVAGLTESEEVRALRKTAGVALKALEPFLPTIGRGMSEANDAASNKRRAMVHSEGVYHYLATRPWHGNTDSFQQYTGFNRSEFDQFYADQGGDRGFLFGEARNSHGSWTEVANKQRRLIRGTLSDRDRVLCWLMMLRKDYCYYQMSDLWGPSASTFERDFKWMTTRATEWDVLNQEHQWPTAAERRAQGAFLEEVAHPAFGNAVFIVDGTKVLMRNVKKPRDGITPDPTQDVNDRHYSANKGLGYSHQIYTNMRGKILRVETGKGAASDRAAYSASTVYTNPEAFLSPGEVGMGDGNYMGEARADSEEGMCVPIRGANLTNDERSFNSAQRRIRVVVENAIGQIKKWLVIGCGKFRHDRDFEPTVFAVCSKLTARIMRVRDAYPRSNEWMWDQYETWESKLGIFLWMDHEDPRSYLVHGIGADLIYQRNNEGDAAELQARWGEVWDLY